VTFDYWIGIGVGVGAGVLGTIAVLWVPLRHQRLEVAADLAAMRGGAHETVASESTAPEPVEPPTLSWLRRTGAAVVMPIQGVWTRLLVLVLSDLPEPSPAAPHTPALTDNSAAQTASTTAVNTAQWRRPPGAHRMGEDGLRIGTNAWPVMQARRKRRGSQGHNPRQDVAT
jgi:hypothetical protein